MKTFLLFVFLLIPLLSRTQPLSDTLIQKYKDEIMKTDIAFNHTCTANGLAKAFIEFAANEVILMKQNQFPILGIDALRERYLKIKSQIKLIWYPVKADVSSSGDLGYTFGNWELVSETANGSDSTSYGVYITIWKKQKDGKWKYVFDGGNDTPQPSKLKSN
jgi:ketosteroid isomerase-like protein